MSESTDERLTRIETKLDMALTRLDGVTSDHEVRLRALERGRWPLPSVAVLLSGAALATSIFGWGP